MIVTRQDFADLCGKKVSYINVYISRGKVVVTPNDKSLIDTDNALNKLFRKKLKDLAEKKKNNPKAQKPKEKPKTEKEPVDTEKIYNDVVEKLSEESAKESNKKQNEESDEVVSWDLRKKIADALKAEEQAKKEALNVQKLMGNLMPVDLVEQIIRINIQEIIKGIENDSINLASIYCDILAGGDREKLAELIGKIRVFLESIIKKVQISAAQEIENVIKDYSVSRGKGEKK